jgi:hypothetical protein
MAASPIPSTTRYKPPVVNHLDQPADVEHSCESNVSGGIAHYARTTNTTAADRELCEAVAPLIWESADATPRSNDHLIALCSPEVAPWLPVNCYRGPSIS